MSITPRYYYEDNGKNIFIYDMHTRNNSNHVAQCYDKDIADKIVKALNTK